MKDYIVYGNCRTYFKVYIEAKDKKEARAKYEIGDWIDRKEIDSDDYTFESIEEDK